MGHRMSRADDTGVPVQYSPAEGVRLLDFRHGAVDLVVRK
jgi:hypothetical protein